MWQLGKCPSGHGQIGLVPEPHHPHANSPRGMLGLRCQMFQEQPADDQNGHYHGNDDHQNTPSFSFSQPNGVGCHPGRSQWPRPERNSVTSTCLPGMVVMSGAPYPGVPGSMIAVNWRNAGCVGGCSVTCPTPSSAVVTMSSAPPLPFCRKSQDLEDFISATLSGRPTVVVGEAGSLYRPSGSFAIKVRTESVDSRVSGDFPAEGL